MTSLWVGLLELLLLKSLLLFTEAVWEVTSRPHHVVYESLTSVCVTWHHVITNRPVWFIAHLRSRFAAVLTRLRELSSPFYVCFSAHLHGSPKWKTILGFWSKFYDRMPFLTSTNL